jgi:hypothetical protein
MPASKQQTEAQLQFTRAAASLTALYKMAHAGQTSANAAVTARMDVRRFAQMAAVEVPGAGERHRGRRFVALDELVAFLDNADLAVEATVPQTFGRKREAAADRFTELDDTVEPGSLTRRGAEGVGTPHLRRLRHQQDTQDPSS